MRRPRVLLGAAGLVLVAVVLLAMRRGDSQGAGVPLYGVHRQDFLRTVLAEGNLRAVQSTPVVAPGNHMAFKIAWLADDGSWVKRGDLLVKFDPTQSQANLALGQGEMTTAEQRIRKERAESGATLSNLERDVEQYRRELSSAVTFQSEDPELFSRHEILEADIDVKLAELRERGTESVHSSRGDLAQTNLDLLAIDRRKAGLKLERAQREQAMLQIAAPHDGFVVFSRDWRGDLPQIGQTIWSGFPIAGLPDLSRMEAEIWVLEADAGGLNAGRPATVVVESNPQVAYQAVVKRVDAVPKPRVRGVPVQYFGATLEFARTEPAVMKPGQRVQATLFLGNEKNALTVPRQAVFERAGRRVVYRRKGRSFQEVEVELGPSTLGLVSIAHGLSDGDVVALRDPTGRSEAKKPKGEEKRSSLPGSPR